MSVIKQLKNKILGNIYPITKFNAVYDDNGNRLSDSITKLNNNLIHSSAEIQCGTFNGKPLYRKIIEYPMNTTTGIILIPHGVELTTIVSIKSYMVKNRDTYVLPYFNNGVQTYITSITAAAITLQNNITTWSGWTFRAAIEYTKN